MHLKGHKRIYRCICWPLSSSGAPTVGWRQPSKRRPHLASKLEYYKE